MTPASAPSIDLACFVIIYIAGMDRATSPDQGLQGTDSPNAWTERLPVALLAFAMVISTWLVLSLNSALPFYADEWDPLLNRTGWGLDQIFAPFNGHPTMIPMVIYKVIQEVFGMDSSRPVQIVGAALLVTMNGALFVYLRRRVGDWAALIATVMVLFLGAAFEILVYSFAMNFTGAIAAGIGALVALDRDDRKGDIAASILLVIGVFFSMVIVPFIAAVAVEWCLNPRDRRDRLFVPGVSIGVLAVWWSIWGQASEESSLVLSNLLLLPGTAFDAIGSGFTSLFGLATGYGDEPDQPNLVWGKVMAVAALALALWRIRMIGSPPRDFLIVMAGLIIYLVMLGMNLSEDRQPTFSRFQLPTVIFILMAAATLLDGIELRKVWLITGAVVAGLAINGGIGLMKERVEERWHSAGLYVKAWLAGTELAGADAAEDEDLGLRMPVMVGVGDYLRAAERYGSPALSSSEVGGLAPMELSWIDAGFANGAGVGLDASPPPATRGSCRRSLRGWAVAVEPGRYQIKNPTQSQVKVLVARLGPPPGIGVGAVLSNASAGMDLPAGDLEEPWLVSFEPDSASVRLCGL